MLSQKPIQTRVAAQLILALSLAVLLGLGLLNVNIPAYIGMPASILVNLPQIRYTIRHGRGPGISVAAWAFLATSSYLWFAYGIGADELPVVINSGIAALLGTTAVLALLLKPAPLTDAHPSHFVHEHSLGTTSGDADLVSGRVDDVEIPLTP
ncbi:MAG: hypothetical protein WEA11_04475 [Acidimicrobiales bacterium]